MPSAFWPLVGFLVTRKGCRASRSRLAGELWPDNDEQAAKHCLSSTLWRVRAALPPETTIIETKDDWLLLNPSSRFWIDALAFQIRVNRALDSTDLLALPHERHRLARTLRLYRSDFLRECQQPWAAIERERMRTLYLDGLFELALAECNSGNWPATVQIASTLCRAEPLREDAQRLLMMAYAQCGNRALALKQFQSCQAALADELGVEPMPETIALYLDITQRPAANRVREAGHLGELIQTKTELEALLSRINARIADTHSLLLTE